jgi:hypothetical protein
VAGKECPGRDREILPARFAAIADSATRARGRVNVQTAASRANWLASRILPAELAESRLRLCVRHAQYVREAEGLGFGGEEEVLGHFRVAFTL